MEVICTSNLTNSEIENNMEEKYNENAKEAKEKGVKERGVGAFQYIFFLRINLELALIFLVISWSFFAINFSQGTSTRSLKNEPFCFLDKTAT